MGLTDQLAGWLIYHQEGPCGTCGVLSYVILTVEYYCQLLDPQPKTRRPTGDEETADASGTD